MHPTRWKFALITLVILALAFFIYQSFQWSQVMTVEESKWMQLWSMAYQKLQSDEEIDLAIEIVKKNETIPIILVDENHRITHYRNLGLKKPDSVSLYRMLDVMADKYPPIVFHDGEGHRYFIYYGDSRIKKWLELFPWAIIGIAMLLAGVAYYAFRRIRQHQEERIWLGLAKETAHQLGTPIMGLMGWLDYLKETRHPLPADIEKEMRRDVERLQKISERFSKIGSPPQKTTLNLTEILHNLAQYLQHRFPTIQIEVTHADDLPPIQGTPLLLEWAFENLIRNAIDAMKGKGTVRIQTALENDHIVVDIIDEGSGIPPGQQNRIFETGFTTKKRGMGLGLPLAQRIIRQHHDGKIFVLKSNEKEGTTFRVVLPIA